MDTEIKIKTEPPQMADPLPLQRQVGEKDDDTAQRLAKFAANRLKHERLRKEVEKAKEAKKEALRLKLEKQELEDKRIQEEILRMQAELEELNQPSPDEINGHLMEEANGDHLEQAANKREQGTTEHEEAVAEQVQEQRPSWSFNALNEDVENLITQEARNGQNATDSAGEASGNQANGVSGTPEHTKDSRISPSGSSQTGSLPADNGYDPKDEALRNLSIASVDGSSRVRLSDYLKECEKFFKSKAMWPAKKQIDFAMIYLVGGLLTTWGERATKLSNPTWEDYKITLFKANTQLEGPQPHRCQKCGAPFGSEDTLSDHLCQSRSCKPLPSPHSPTNRKTTRPVNGTEAKPNATNGSDPKLGPRRKPVHCSQCNLPFPSMHELGRHRDVTGHAVVSPTQPKPSLLRAPTGPKIPETTSLLSNVPSQSTNTCSVCITSFRNHHDLVQHLHNSGHMMTKKHHHSPPPPNPMGAPPHPSPTNKRNGYATSMHVDRPVSPIAGSPELDRRTCRTCNRIFQSRVEMHEHLRESGHAVSIFPPKHRRSNPNPYPEPSLSLHRRTGSGGYGGAQHYSSSQDEEYIGLGPLSDSPTRSRSYKDPQRTCEKCDTEFPSRIEMFEHIREAGHVMPRKRGWPGRYDDDGGLGGRVSMVRRKMEY